MEAFQTHSVVPDVTDDPPQALLQVRYGDVDLSPGNQMTPTQMKNKPDISYQAKEGEFYTLIMPDPDAPSREDHSMRNFLHWLNVNIPGSDVGKGEEIVDYIGSGAPKGTGLHRYVFLVFRQTKGKRSLDGLTKIPNSTGQGRAQFDVKTFAKTNSLEMVAGNFLQAEWDDYVPLLHKQLGFKPPP